MVYINNMCKFENNFEAIHNKDYSVVKTLGSLVLNGGFFFSPNTTFRITIFYTFAH